MTVHSTEKEFDKHLEAFKDFLVEHLAILFVSGVSLVIILVLLMALGSCRATI